MNVIIVERLLKLYEPWRYLGCRQPLTLDMLARVKPVSEYLDPMKREGPDMCGLPGWRWHAGRVRHLYERILGGWEPDPIEIDNVCSGGAVYPIPIVEDGHHRLIAAGLAARPSIQATYGGRVDLLNYLTGKTNRCPQC